MWLADAEKNVPDPPRTLSALPNGVSTESSATEPTTRTLMLRKREKDGCQVPEFAMDHWRPASGAWRLYFTSVPERKCRGGPSRCGERAATREPAPDGPA